MKDLIFLAVMGLIIYVVGRLFLKEPILPWSKKKEKTVGVKGKINKSKQNDNPLDEEEAAPFQELFSDVDTVEQHMIKRKDNTFTMIAEVEPVNYYLLDQDEQEGIDAVFETWLAMLSYSVRIYLQNRFVDLSIPIQELQENMDQDDHLHPHAYEFGQGMINDLLNWQSEQPRYETKRYILFDYKVDTKDIRADNPEELEEKMWDKAFSELRRRLNTAKDQLRRADMDVQMLATDGIIEVLYYGFNRKKARKNQYRHIEEKEQLALYVTADQSASLIARVKGEIEDAQRFNRTEEIEERTDTQQTEIQQAG